MNQKLLHNLHTMDTNSLTKKLVELITPIRESYQALEDIYYWKEFYKTLTVGMVLSLTVFFNKLILLIIFNKNDYKSKHPAYKLSRAHGPRGRSVGVGDDRHAHVIR